MTETLERALHKRSTMSGQSAQEKVLAMTSYQVGGNWVR